MWEAEKNRAGKRAPSEYRLLSKKVICPVIPVIGIDRSQIRRDGSQLYDHNCWFTWLRLRQQPKVMLALHIRVSASKTIVTSWRKDLLDAAGEQRLHTCTHSSFSLEILRAVYLTGNGFL